MYDSAYLLEYSPDMTNVTVDFTKTIFSTDPLGVGFVCSEFGGSTVPLVSNTGNWQQTLKALSPGVIRASIAYYGGNPGYGAGGSSRTPGTGTGLVNAIKATGAIPLISFNGDTSDNGFNPADGGSLVHYFNDNGGQNGGPVKYWSIGNEADISGTAAYEAGSGTGSAIAAAAAMVAADPTIVIGMPAAAYWNTSFLSWAATQNPGAISWHEYDGQSASNGNPFPNSYQYGNNIDTARGSFPKGLIGIEELNWSPSYTSQSAFTSWENTLFIADTLGQCLTHGAHGIVYSDSNGHLGILDDGSVTGTFGTTMPAYWGIGIFTGMNGQFKAYSEKVVSSTVTLPFSEISVFSFDNNKMVICNKSNAAQNLSIGVTLPGGATSGTYKVWSTNATNPYSPITNTSNSSFTGNSISYTIPAQTAVSVDITPASTITVTPPPVTTPVVIPSAWQFSFEADFSSVTSSTTSIPLTNATLSRA